MSEEKKLEESQKPAAPVAKAEVKVEDKKVEKQAAKESLPHLRPGYTVRIHQKIKEGEKERVQVFEGIIIALRGKTPVTKTVTVRKVSSGIGVEKIFPLASPTIEKIEIVKKARVKRAKLYFLRDYKKRLKETLVK